MDDFCCIDCGEFYSDDEWNDGDICNSCFMKKFNVFKKERDLEVDFKRWLNKET